MGLGKMIIFGGMSAMVAMQAHDLLACELDQAPRKAAEVIRKPAMPILLARPKVVEREASYMSLRSRRIILQ